ncbi:alpha/beta fold hydrolase [Amycolatopsis sp. cmx-4-54]|uniref:alpha/beta fold hydrolase n=1 Tax=Amycolatopsis sp. cmx-4-54 TaxID=2790936 RepID=UPI003979A966
MSVPNVAGMTNHFAHVVRGSGPGLLLAHGGGGSVEGNFGSILDDLARTHTVVGPDYPGSGATPRSTEPLDLDAVADELVSIAVDAGLERFAILGYSLGTGVAVRAATRHPDRVTGLILTAGFTKPDNRLLLAVDIWRELLGGDRKLLAKFLTFAATGEKHLNALTPSELEAAIEGLAGFIPEGSPEHVGLVANVDPRRTGRDLGPHPRRRHDPRRTRAARPLPRTRGRDPRRRTGRDRGRARYRHRGPRRMARRDRKVPRPGVVFAYRGCRVDHCDVYFMVARVRYREIGLPFGVFSAALGVLLVRFLVPRPIGIATAVTAGASCARLGAREVDRPSEDFVRFSYASVKTGPASPLTYRRGGHLVENPEYRMTGGSTHPCPYRYSTDQNQDPTSTTGCDGAG